ncbi:insulinase family protein [Stappia sp. GBMRC 2046]|uniref:Insulinase family protein n=2 Tax=Stappia sediminis TaxID=2692190 RepID=A0A7X3LW39_9HYPH|nr:insulinase family protein [Stappia sediminis]
MTVSALADPQAAATSADFADIRVGGDIATFTLQNGMEGIVIPDHRAPVVTHMVWYKVGSADEAPGKSGIAHFFEHLMFKGTKNHPAGEFSAMVAAIGGSENAFTSNDYTAYFQRVAKEHLGTMMTFEADRMANLVLTEEVIAPEREVVLEERRQRVENDPGSKLGETLDAMLYVNHPYGVPVIGWKNEIEALNKVDAIDFYNRYYTPNNAILIVAGDVTTDEVKALAEETYGKLERRAEPGERSRPEPQTVPGEQTVTLSDPQVNQPNMRQAWLVPSYNTAEGTDAEAIDVLAQILGGGNTSRLYEKLVVEDGVAAAAGSWYQSSALDDTRFMIYAVPRDGTTLNELASATSAVLQNVIDNGVSGEELERAKKSLLSSTIYAQDNQATMARIFGVALTTGGTVEEVQAWPARLASVSVEDVQAAARKYLAGSPVTAFLKGPETASGAANTAATGQKS